MLKGKIFKKYSSILQVFLLIIALLLLILNPKINMQSFLDGIILWAKFVMPALFPILFLTSILNFSGLTIKIGKIFSPITTKLFNCSGVAGYIYLMSILSGYPVGAKITSELYEKNIISFAEASRITSFTSTSGPLFIIGTVGVGMFGSFKAGAIILISHILGAAINGILFRNLYTKNCYNQAKSLNSTKQDNILENSMLSTIKAVLIIGGYIALAYMIISLFEHNNFFYLIDSYLCDIFQFESGTISSILQGFIEITKGCHSLGLSHLSIQLKTIIACGIITLGGASIFLQAYTYLAKFRIKLKIYFLQKILHTAISITICSILVFIF